MQEAFRVLFCLSISHRLGLCSRLSFGLVQENNRQRRINGRTGRLTDELKMHASAWHYDELLSAWLPCSLPREQHRVSAGKLHTTCRLI